VNGEGVGSSALGVLLLALGGLALGAACFRRRTPSAP
jgi:hypothetical protein